jgi:hypothetical protein
LEEAKSLAQSQTSFPSTCEDLDSNKDIYGNTVSYLNSVCVLNSPNNECYVSEDETLCISSSNCLTSIENYKCSTTIIVSTADLYYWNSGNYYNLVSEFESGYSARTWQDFNSYGQQLNMIPITTGIYSGQYFGSIYFTGTSCAGNRYGTQGVLGSFYSNFSIMMHRGGGVFEHVSDIEECKAIAKEIYKVNSI